jgi:hypothetical protein
MNENYVSGSALNILVQGRLIEDATCATTTLCKFTYSNDISPTLAPLDASVVIKSGVTVTLTGTRFTSFAKVLIGPLDKEIVVTGAIVSDTSVTFTVPAFAYGTYDLKV